MATATTGIRTDPEDPDIRAEERPRPFRITVDLYDRMVEAGVFGGRSPVYLWKGQLVEPMTEGSPHEFSLAALNELLVLLRPAGWHVRPAGPTRLTEDSEPEPDLTVVRGSARDYATRHPGPEDVALAVEVADSSYRFDSGEKLRAYAAAGIPVYWVVNVRALRIDVYTRPTGPADAPGYDTKQGYGPGDDVPVVLDGREVGRVRAGDVLP